MVENSKTQFSTKTKAETAKGAWDRAKTEESWLSLRKSKIYPICMIFMKFMVS